MTDTDYRQRLIDHLELELLPEPPAADRHAATIALRDAPGGWERAFTTLAPGFLELAVALCHGDRRLAVRVLDSAAWDAEVHDTGDRYPYPFPPEPITPREPYAGDQRAVLEYLRAALGAGGGDLEPLRASEYGMSGAFSTLARMFANLVVVLCRNDIDQARALLRSQSYGESHDDRA